MTASVLAIVVFGTIISIGTRGDIIVMSAFTSRGIARIVGTHISIVTKLRSSTYTNTIIAFIADRTKVSIATGSIIVYIRAGAVRVTNIVGTRIIVGRTRSPTARFISAVRTFSS